MNTFETYKNIAHWDLTINRADYRKQVMSAFIGFGVVLLIHLMPQIFGLMIDGRDRINVYSCATTDDIFAHIITFCTPIVFILRMSNIFSVLQTKQGRINEFMLPATNLQRFLWRTISVILSTAIVLLAGIVAYDLIQMLVHTVVFPHYPVQSVLATTFNILNDIVADMLHVAPRADLELFVFFTKLYMVLGVILFASTFILGSAIRYKRAMVWTLLFHFLFNMLLAFLMIFVATNIPEGLVREFVEYLFDNESSWLVNHPAVIPAFACLVNLVLIVIMWRFAYKLYCRAQLVTRLNP